MKLAPSHYAPYGLGFEKDWVFQHGGGPAFYVRGDDWDDFTTSALPNRVKAFGTKFWPGLEDPTGIVSSSVLSPNEWAHEREWRVPRTDEAPNLTFEDDDVAVLIVSQIEEVAFIRGSLPRGALARPTVFVLDQERHFVVFASGTI